MAKAALDLAATVRPPFDCPQPQDHAGRGGAGFSIALAQSVVPVAVAAGTLCLRKTDPVPDPSCHRSGLAQAKGMTVRRNSPPVAATPHLITGRPRTSAENPSVFASTALALNSVLTASTAVPPP
ncbi:MAG: hypothetical protein IOC96_00805 [Rhodobacter sp.]|nr:hypothetical protein [Rhodobacter sp.]MCA3521228.1 hypothetical protein [Rhodobacter sp.]MCA3556936.1 hypothetical protein [Rhodobacter sp.]